MKTKYFKTTFLLSFFFAISHLAIAQQNKPLPDFNKINVDESFEVQLFHSDRNSIIYNTKSDDEIVAEVKNGTLNIKSNFNSQANWKVTIYFREINEINISGIASVTSNDTISTSYFIEKIEGTAKSNLIVKCDSIKINAEGITKINMAGTATSAYYNLEGLSTLKALDLVSQKVKIIAEGKSNAQVQAKESLVVKAEGISQILYTGAPVNKSISIEGLAIVKDKSGNEEFNNKTAHINKNNGDTTKLKLGKKKFMIIDEDGDDEIVEGSKGKSDSRKMKSVWGGFALGVNSLTTRDMYFNFNNNYKFLNTKMGESWFFDLNLPEYDAPIIRNKLALTMGLGMQWNNIHFEGNSFMTPKSDTLGSTNAGVNLSLNKLFTFDITAPLMIKFAPGSSKSAKGGFHLAAGVIGHYITTSSIVTETSANGYFQRTEIHDNFNINPFRLDATVRAGYGHVKLFANYSLTPYYDVSKAPDVRLFAAGITLIGF